MSYVSEVQADNPIAWWRFRESAVPFVDEVAAHPFTYAAGSGGIAPLPSGPVTDGAIEFDGTSAGLVCLSFLNTSVAFSVEFWIKPYSLTGDSFQVGPGGSEFYFVLDANGAATCGVYNGGTNFEPVTHVPNGTFSIGAWHHVVYTNDGTGAGNSAKFYVNGILIAQGTHAVPVVGNVWYVDLGYAEGNNQGHGGFDELAIYDHALSAARVAAHYGTAATSTYRDTVLADSPAGYWRRGEADGIVSFDISGNNRHGTYFGPGNGEPAHGVPGAIAGDLDTAVTHGSFSTHDTLDDYTDLPTSSASGASVLTFEAWLKWDPLADDDQKLFCVYDASESPPKKIEFTPRASGSGKAEFVGYSAATGTDKATYASALGGAWYHVVCVAAGPGGTSRLYLNGAQVATVSGMALPSAVTKFYIGRGTPDEDPPLLTGTIDEVAVYDYELSPGRVLIHYLVGTSGTGLARWTREERGARAAKAFGGELRGGSRVVSSFAGELRGGHRVGFGSFGQELRGAHAFMTTWEQITRGASARSNTFGAESRGVHNVGYTPFARVECGAGSIFGTFGGTSSGGFRVGYEHCDRTERGRAAVYAAFSHESRGAYTMMVSCAADLAGNYRVANAALDRYEVYRGVDGAAIDFAAAPWATFISLPFATSALAAGHTYSLVVRRRNAWGLVSQNVDAYTFTVNGGGGQTAEPPSAPREISASAAAAGTVRVRARYDYAADGSDQADAFLVYLRSNGTDPDPATDTPTVVAMRKFDGVAKLDHRTSAFTEGTVVKVIVRARRTGSPSVDSTNSDVYSATATLLGPAAPAPAEIFIGRVAKQQQ